jgi:hypothetical protein
MRYWMVSDGVSAWDMKKRADQRSTSQHETQLHFILELDDAGKVLGGEWLKAPSYTNGPDGKEIHPDFFWMATKVNGWGEDADDMGGDNDNPYVSYAAVRALLDCANDANTCAPSGGNPPPPPPPSGPSCEGNCGGSASAGDEECWCDDLCTEYGDCCADYAQFCQ